MTPHMTIASNPSVRHSKLRSSRQMQKSRGQSSEGGNLRALIGNLTTFAGDLFVPFVFLPLVRTRVNNATDGAHTLFFFRDIRNIDVNYVVNNSNGSWERFAGPPRAATHNNNNKTSPLPSFLSPLPLFLFFLPSLLVLFLSLRFVPLSPLSLSLSHFFYNFTIFCD